jgi:hypothetical protein
MAIGKTFASVSKEDVFSKYTEVQIISAVFPEITSLPHLMQSPLREDNNPSFSIYMSNGNHIYYKDFATGDRGNIWTLLCEYWNCSFNQMLSNVCSLFITDSNVALKPKQLRILTKKEADSLSKIQVAVRSWKDYDYEYWASYGIEKKWLKHAEVYPISHKIITKKENPTDKGKRYIFPADQYAYCYVERKEGKLQLKIYQPFNKKFKWCSKMDSSVIGLWTKIPETGDRVVICSSLKDALCLSCQCHIPAVCLQGEGYSMSDTAAHELKRRYSKVFICFDTDKAGKADSKKLAKQTGFINVIPDLGAQKDLSDYYKALENKEQFKELEKLFN